MKPGVVESDNIKSEAPEIESVPELLLITVPPKSIEPGPTNKECQRFDGEPKFQVTSEFGVIFPVTSTLPDINPPVLAKNVLSE